ncbi:fluoride efflux transporter CrcB [Hymenobacter profundi]|uniref:Fluoride efflux transporter CrcB n=1 Tax=Hymenobacter profundi TaxID=1982110 RepID=A0ABS6WUB1_9BACT|nr:fluoride efflux transporter CrcB [Hymenobacter profundi]MBW3127167.1 fluoride efflux transporter CrcB [Hymenobacter profundi]
MTAFSSLPLLPGGLPLTALLVVWGSCLLFGFVLGVYDRRLASLGPKLPLYVMGIVSFTAFFHVMYEGLSRHLGPGPLLLYGGGSLLLGLLLAGVGLWLSRFA